MLFNQKSLSRQLNCFLVIYKLSAFNALVAVAIFIMSHVQY